MTKTIGKCNGCGQIITIKTWSDFHNVDDCVNFTRSQAFKEVLEIIEEYNTLHPVQAQELRDKIKARMKG